MPLRFPCSCGKQLQVADEHAGRRVRCPDCGAEGRAPPAGDAQGSLGAAQAVMVGAAASRLAASGPAPPPLPPGRDVAVTRSPRAASPLLPAAPPPLPEADIDASLESLSLVTHAGEPPDEDDDFFVAAPSEIGRVLSAQTSLKTGTQPWSWPVRIGLLAPAFVLSLALLAFLVSRAPGQIWIVPVLLAGWILLLLVLTRFRHTCTYVGSKPATSKPCRSGMAWSSSPRWAASAAGSLPLACTSSPTRTSPTPGSSSWRWTGCWDSSSTDPRSVHFGFFRWTLPAALAYNCSACQGRCSNAEVAIFPGGVRDVPS